MENIFLAFVILLLCIALFDLVVGVSNDAVNFLTSAIGSRAGTFRTIMIVASVGIFLGAASSGGLMEIAKRGIFNPSFFTFQDIIFIYVVVMLTDVFLLDLFNSLRLPTSTTISIVFELLGASLALSFLHVLDANEPVSVWMNYLNTAKALEMIIAIFASVAIAFVVGWFVQYVLRGVLTFEYRRHGRIAGALFGGVAIEQDIGVLVSDELRPFLEEPTNEELKALALDEADDEVVDAVAVEVTEVRRADRRRRPDRIEVHQHPEGPPREQREPPQRLHREIDR